MPELNIKQLAFTYTSYGPLANQKDRKIQYSTLQETRDSSYTCYLEKLIKQRKIHYDAGYGDNKDLVRRTAYFLAKPLIFSIIFNMLDVRHSRGLASMVSEIFD